MPDQEVVITSEQQTLETPNMTDEELREWIRQKKEEEQQGQ